MPRLAIDGENMIFAIWRKKPMISGAEIFGGSSDGIREGLNNFIK